MEAASRSSRRRSLCAIAFVLAVAFAAVVAVPLVNYVLCYALVVVVALATPYLLLVPTADAKGGGDPTLLSADAELEGAAAPPPPPPPRGKSSRLYFLDNVKSALTALVVLHHTAGQSFGAGGGWLSLFGFRNPFLIFNTALSLLDQYVWRTALCGVGSTFTH